MQSSRAQSQSEESQSEEDGRSTKPNHRLLAITHACQRKLINSNQSKYHLNTRASEHPFLAFSITYNCLLCLHSVFIFVALNDAEQKGVV